MIAPHRYLPGQRVTIAIRTSLSNAARGVYEIVKQLPPESGDNLYRIKSELERHERVVGESQLTRVS